MWSSAACGPTVVGEVAPEERTVWLTMRDAAVAEAEAFLGPALADGQARLVESAHGNSILVADETELEPLAAFFHDRYHRCGGFATHGSLEEARDAIAAPPLDVPGLADGLELAASESDTVKRLLPQVDPAAILATITGLTSFPTRHYQSTGGVDAANWLRDRWTQMAAGRDDVTVELFPHAGWAQPSVIMTIEGADTPDEVIVIGGHLDSITFSGSTAPGADDDASGVASLTEVARLVLADEVRLQKTVKFMAYAAEEVGLRGSDEISDQFAAQSVQVVGVMQLDMTNYNGTAGTDIVLLTDYTSAALTDFVESLAGTYLPDLVVGRDACGYACSDHASWQRAGYATVMPFESLLDDYNPTIHTSQDTLSVSGNNAKHAAKFAKLALAWVIESAKISGGETPPATVLFAQVAYDIEGLDGRGEFVELSSTGGAAVAVGGWTISDRRGTWTIPAATTVPATGFLTIGRNRAGFIATYGQAPDVWRMSLALGNAGDALTLRDASGQVIDYVEWESPSWPITAGIGSSLLRTAATDTDTSADWSVATADPR